MASKAPLRESECQFGHRFAHRTTPGRSTRCTHVLGPDDAARRDGPDGRPLPDGAKCGSSTYVRQDATAGAIDPRVALWRDLAPWTDSPSLSALPASAEPCPECGADTLLTPRGTVLFCPACKATRPPERVSERAEVRQASAARSAQVASPVGELRARLDLAERKERAAANLDRWAEACDPAGVGAGDLADVAAGFVGRFRVLARECRSAATPSALAAVRELAGETITAAQRADIQRRLAAAADDDGAADDDEYSATLASQGAARVAAQWAMRIDALIDDFPDPASLTPPYARVASRHLAALADARDEFGDARDIAALAAATNAAGPLIDTARDALRALRAVAPAPAPAALAYVRPAVRATPGVADMASVKRALQERKARAARYGPCQIPGGHPVATLLGNQLPPAVMIVQGGRIGPDGAGHRIAAMPAIYVCGAVKCRDRACRILESQGCRDQVYEVLE